MTEDRKDLIVSLISEEVEATRDKEENKLLLQASIAKDIRKIVIGVFLYLFLSILFIVAGAVLLGLNLDTTFNFRPLGITLIVIGGYIALAFIAVLLKEVKDTLYKNSNE